MILELKDESLKVGVVILGIVLFVLGFYIGNSSNDGKEYVKAYIQCTEQKQQLIDAIEIQSRLAMIEKENRDLKKQIKDMGETNE